MKQIKALFKPTVAAVVVAGCTAQQAMAALPAEVEAALTTAKTDGVAVAGIVLGVIISIAAFKFIRKAI